MASGENQTSSDNQQRKWYHIRRLLESETSPFCHPDYEPSPEILDFIKDSCKVLIVGAGELAGNLLKQLAILGFKTLHIVDADILDRSSMYRQFRLWEHGIELKEAVKFVKKRVPGCETVVHHCAIQDLDMGFYRQYHIVVCGIDSMIGSSSLDEMLMSLRLLQCNDDSPDESSTIPLIDGGTEGFKGNARVIWPGMSVCIECTLDFDLPQKTFSLFNIATPRLPEHCIEYVKLIQWAKENPFGSNIALDGDDPQHVAWVFEKAQDRAVKHGISNVTYTLTEGFLKNIIPAVASTDAAIAGCSATEG